MYQSLGGCKSTTDPDTKRMLDKAGNLAKCLRAQKAQDPSIGEYGLNDATIPDMI